jgi:methylmalonyl-CoA epimerase
MKPLKLDHVGIVVARLSDAVARWEPILGPPEAPPEEVPGSFVRVVFLSVGDTHLELVEPIGLTSPVSKFLAKRGEGIHHVAFRVNSVDEALADVRARGGQVIDQSWRPGARGHRVGFAHPSAFGGILVEFVEAH